MSEEKKKLKKEDYETTANKLEFHAVNTATQETTKNMREEITNETSKENNEITL